MSRNLRVNNVLAACLVLSLATAGCDTQQKLDATSQQENVVTDAQAIINTHPDNQAITLAADHRNKDQSPNDLAAMIAKNKQLKAMSEQQAEALSKQMEGIEKENKRLEDNISLQNQQIESLKEKIRLLSEE